MRGTTGAWTSASGLRASKTWNSTSTRTCSAVIKGCVTRPQCPAPTACCGGGRGGRALAAGAPPLVLPQRASTHTQQRGWTAQNVTRSLLHTFLRPFYDGTPALTSALSSLLCLRRLHACYLPPFHTHMLILWSQIVICALSVQARWFGPTWGCIEGCFCFWVACQGPRALCCAKASAVVHPTNISVPPPPPAPAKGPGNV